ncbi:conserved protein of unknown function [Xenorhabdus poinarii G6]|uniref:Uncharacterized protein n=1 Tax=Xenorhabdus poinarii G6 TaxID=1354304 RepID=A0A068QY15_9GAMM|nr:conserved protein of unknown function [Xenorhabdus poinarii G6]
MAPSLSEFLFVFYVFLFFCDGMARGNTDKNNAIIDIGIHGLGGLKMYFLMTGVHELIRVPA